jgi:hypothetical protein
MDQQRDQREHRTSDLYFGAYLMTAGCTLKKTERAMNRVFFIFDYSPLLEELKIQYFNGEAKVKAQAYAAQIKNLKSLTHQILAS